MKLIRITSALQASPALSGITGEDLAVGFVFPCTPGRDAHVVDMDVFVDVLGAATTREEARKYQMGNKQITAVIVDPACCEVVPPSFELYKDLLAAKMGAVEKENFEHAAVLRDEFNYVKSQVPT